MISKNDGFTLFKLQFPQYTGTKTKEFSEGLGLLAKEVDDSLRKKSLNSVSRAFEFVNYLITNGNNSIRQQVHLNFFKKLKTIPVHYPIGENQVQGPSDMQTLKRYRIHYRVSRDSGCWCVKSIKINP
jgi:hypothetical protein